MQTCETCRFAHINWRKGDKYMVHTTPPTEQARPATSVQCRKNAPAKATLENDHDGWPWIAGDDWCGEHQPKGTKHD